MEEKTDKLIGERPPLPEWARKYIREVRDKMNEEALISFTDHNILLMLIDRGHLALHPKRKEHPKRKKYQRIPF